MAVIQSSRPQGSALPSFGVGGEDPDLLEEVRTPEPEPEREPLPEADHGSPKDRLVAWIEENNIARHIDDQTLNTLGMLVTREYDIDENSRSEWKEEAKKALKFATQEAEAKQYPWPKASNIIFPLITSAAIEFNARTYPAIVQGRKIVKGVTWGTDKGTPATQDGKPDGAPKVGPDGQPVWLVPPGAKRLRADRVAEHMSWQLIDQMAYWEEQTDTMLFQLPIVGGAVRKTYRDPTEERNESELVPLENLCWNKNAKSFDTAPRHTEILELYPVEILDYEKDDETFLPLVYGAGDSAGEEGDDAVAGESGDTEAPHFFLEQHRRYDLDGDGYPEPLIITVHKRSSKVVRIVARYEEDGIKERTKGGEIQRIEAVQHYTLYPFLPDPKGGSYPIGFGHLLKPLNEAVNSSLNQMFDAGHLQNTGGGFYGTSLSVAAGPMNFQLGEFKPVNTKGMNIRDAIFPMPWQGPNAVLFQLLGFLVSEAKAIASTQNILAGDAATLAKAAPTTMLALIEQGMQVYTAIHKRIYRALKFELNKLYRLNRLYLDKDEPFRVGDTWRVVEPEDYRLGGGVEPIADPTMVTDLQRLGRAAVVGEFKDDALINPIEARRRIFEAASIENIDRLLATQMPPPPPSAQMELATQQAELGRIRAAETKDATQGVLNLALARAKASGPEMEWIDRQIEFLRLHIEALNTQVKAADVDAKVHGHNTHLEAVRQRASAASDEQPSGAGAPPQPQSGGADGGGLAAMAPPPNNGGVSPIPSGLPGSNGGGDLGALGIGGAAPGG